MRISYSFQGVERTFETKAQEIVVGRPSEGQPVDLDLSPDLKVSRRHARITVHNGEVWVEDLDSTRGTLVGEEEIKGKGKRRLSPDDIVRMGQTEVRVEAAPRIKIPEAPETYGEDVSIGQTIDASGRAFEPSAGARSARDRLALLYELPLELGEDMPLDDLLQKIVDRLLKIIPRAARGALVVLDKRTGKLLLKAHTPQGDPAVSMTLAKRAMEQRQGFLWQRGQEDPSFSISDQGIGSGMYVPLMWKGQILGVVCVDNCETCAAFVEDDLRLMIAVAQQAAMAVATHQLQDDLRRNASLLARLLTNFSPKIRDRLLDKARNARLRLGGEKSEVTILFSDIRGFTKMSAGMEADDVMDMLNHYFPALIDPIFKNDGTIDKFVGDAILAVFGSPEPDAEQHQKAVRAALGMQSAIARLNESRKAAGEMACGIGIGVHCGEVVHGFIGSAERMEFTVIGDAVNRASRYCSAAGAGEVLISPELYQRVWKAIQAEKTSIPTKHEGDFAAYRVKALKP